MTQSSCCSTSLSVFGVSSILDLDHSNRYIVGEGNGNPLQYSCLENPVDGGAWWATVHGVAKSWTRLSNFTSLFIFLHQRRKWQPTPVFLPGESQGRGNRVGCRLWGRTESDTTEAIAAAVCLTWTLLWRKRSRKVSR